MIFELSLNKVLKMSRLFHQDQDRNQNQENFFMSSRHLMTRTKV